MTFPLLKFVQLICRTEFMTGSLTTRTIDVSMQCHDHYWSFLWIDCHSFQDHSKVRSEIVPESWADLSWLLSCCKFVLEYQLQILTSFPSQELQQITQITLLWWWILRIKTDPDIKCVTHTEYVNYHVFWMQVKEDVPRSCRRCFSEEIM